MEILAGVVVLAAIAALLWPRVRRELGRRRKRQYVLYLQREYVRKLQLPRRRARRTLARHVEELSNEQPGRPLEWYLEKLLNDLERARR